MPAPASTLLRNAPHRPAPTLDLGAGASLRLGRLHEACGNARRTLALRLAARIGVTPQRPLFWIAPAWSPDRLNGDGMARFLSPAAVIFVHAVRAEDILWTAEEVLRAGAAPMMVADLPGLPSLTAVRRMHLAAETGAEAGRVLPLGLILTEGAGGAPGVESRWRMDAAHPPCPGDSAPEGEAWRLERLRARTDPPRVWRVAGGRLEVVTGDDGGPSPGLPEPAEGTPASRRMAGSAENRPPFTAASGTGAQPPVSVGRP